MTEPIPLTGVGGLPLGPPQPVERSDAARNRARLLDSARRIIDIDGVAGLTMDRLATEAGVGKGTIFRRFGSRAGLLSALLDDTEREFQAAFISGPAPLGPGAPPLDRLAAYGRARIELFSTQGDLLRASEAGGMAEERYTVPARRISEVHIASLLRQAEVGGDIRILAFNLLSVLEAILLLPPGAKAELTLSRLARGWDELVDRLRL
ncbi:TetR/AcrR family transcriptional regulator [Herbiconiux daphne]|uniref:TetR/AcrR family transcriptional regulator n=1 Tax=Herbiconiux daphne TaxID=2970914 RepID=A0ABT2H6C1_9MICO|nr:TetR/AcrR family transcriptional regulator [Herbiconiux daphne]MCS5735495.1 TetR/AcrR family transcriptional regulator [Herbiconiux daphne]